MMDERKANRNLTQQDKQNGQNPMAARCDVSKEINIIKRLMPKSVAKIVNGELNMYGTLFSTPGKRHKKRNENNAKKTNVVDHVPHRI